MNRRFQKKLASCFTPPPPVEKAACGPLPLDTPHTLPYGVVYSVRAGEGVLKFVEILQHEAEKIK